MPQSIAYFIWAVTPAFVTQAVATAIANVIVASALAYASTKYQQRQLKQNLKAGPKEVIIRDTTQPQLVVYGETYVGGVIAYMNTVHPGVNQGHELHMAVLVAGHEIEDVTDIYLDDTLLDAGGALDWTANAVVSGTYDPDSRTDCEAVKVWKHLGTSTQTVDLELNAHYTTDWTSDYRLRGLAYLVFRFKLTTKSETLWAGGPPQSIRIKVKGKKCYDPRTGTTVWTSNPVLCAADYMTSFMGVASSRMDWDWIGAQADICDTLVDIPGPSTEKRYTCNGAVSLGDKHGKNIGDILSSCMGRLAKVNGKWRITAGAYEAPTISLTDADIVGPIVMSTSLQRSERFNTVRGVFGMDPSNKHREMEFRQVTSSAYVTRDNGETIVRSLSLPMTAGEYMAQRIAFKTLNQGDQQTTVTLPVRWTGLKVAVGSGVCLTVAKFGWSSKVFRCIGWKMGGGGEAPFELVLREDSPAAWADPAIAEYTTVSASGAITLPTESTPKDNPAPAPQNVIPFGLGEFEVTALTELTAMSATALVLDTSQAYLGSKSLKVTGPVTNGATWGVYLAPTVSSSIVDNTFFAPGRRWMVICSIRPGSADSVGNDVDYKIGIRNGTNAATLSAANNALAHSTWNRVAFEVDMTGNSYKSGKVVIQATNDSLRSTAPYFWIDAIALVDVTDNPSITEENFFEEHIPSSGTANPVLSAYRVKTADETRTSTTTLAADADLNGWVLEAGKTYSVEWFFLYKGNSSGDFKWRLVCSQTPRLIQGIRIFHGLNVGGAEGVVDYEVLTTATTDQTDGTTDASAVHQRGSAILQAHATNDGTLELQWAQGSSSGTATTLMEGSWMSVTKMD